MARASNILLITGSFQKGKDLKNGLVSTSAVLVEINFLQD